MSDHPMSRNTEKTDTAVPSGNKAAGLSQPGRLFIVSAPSGAGKTTLCNAVRQTFPDLSYSISHTTRAPRSGEQHGVDYFFISETEFKKRIKDDVWAEWAKVHDHFYGTSARFIDRELAAGKDILLDIDFNGARQILARYPDSITVFIMPPSFESLEKRLVGRGTDSPETISKRLKTAKNEMENKAHYQHIVVNDALPEAIQKLAAIISSHRTGKPF